MEFISPVFRLEFREFCVSLVLRQIDDIFQMAGFQRATLPVERNINGERRTRVEEYYTTIKWDDINDAQRYLKVISLVLSQSYISDQEKTHLQNLCSKEGLVVDAHEVRFGSLPSGATVKNLIFAADGPKPEIVLTDSTTNEIKIVANEEYCLIYTKPILQHGLLWTELTEWWSEKNAMHNLTTTKPERELYERLSRSLSSEPEKMLFRDYFVLFHSTMGEKLPALIPQVYLHYDPYSARQLRGKKRLIRQRMDFLLLLPNENRIVIEIDGSSTTPLKMDWRIRNYTQKW